MNNPDAGADYDLINKCIVERMMPVLKMIDDHFDELDKKTDQALGLSTAIVTSMNDAVMGNKKDQFSSLLSSKFGDDLGPIDQFYSDTMGGKFSDSLVDELLSNEPENPEEYISSRIGEARGKYGKYLGGGAPEMPHEVAAEGAEEEEAAAHLKGEAEPAVAVKVESKPKKVTSKDMADMLGVRLNPK